jgi:hypothetical protein
MLDHCGILFLAWCDPNLCLFIRTEAKRSGEICGSFLQGARAKLNRSLPDAMATYCFPFTA